MLAVLPIALDPSDLRPLYLQIMDELRRCLATGALQAGDPVPSVRELAAHLVVNPRTVLQAYQELERAGVLYVKRGQGTFIAPSALVDRQILAQDVAQRAVLDARRHGLTTAELVRAIQRTTADEDDEPLVSALGKRQGVRK